MKVRRNENMLRNIKGNKNLVFIIVIGLIIRVILNNIVDSNDAKSFVIWANFLSQNINQIFMPRIF